MKTFLIFPILLFATTLSFSQNTGETLDKKWDKMLNKAETFQLYKVINKAELGSVWKSVQDTVSQYKVLLNKERSQISQQQSQIASLQKQLSAVQTKLASETSVKDNMTFMKMEVNKYTYTTLLWVLIIIGFAGCAVLLFLFLNSNRTTVRKTKDYEQLFKELEEYKQSKIEVERKLKREIQTNMNTIEELKSKKRWE